MPNPTVTSECMCYTSEAIWICSRKPSFPLAPWSLITGYCEGHDPQVVLALTVYGQCRFKEAVGAEGVQQH